MTFSGGDDVALTPGNMILHRDNLLLNDNCQSANAFYPHSFSSSDELFSYHSVLVSALSSPHHTACASCYLCHIHLHAGDLEAHSVAYIYASRALTRYPQLSPALSCISALYIHQGNILRAGFFAELAYRRCNDKSHVVYYDVIGNHDHLHKHLQREGEAVLRYRRLSSCVDFVPDDEEHSVVREIMSSLQDESTTLLDAYLNHLHLLPRTMVGPSIVAYEAFLDHIEESEKDCTDGVALSQQVFHVG